VGEVGPVAILLALAGGDGEGGEIVDFDGDGRVVTPGC
jgi:hypothetical protein